MPFLSGNICFHRITTFHSTFVSTTFQVPIERDDGCAQMMCKNCRHVFCWFCLASLDDDFMLRHYDSGLPRSTFSRLKRFNIFVVGPCRSRLGHSRISVVWHRTQVRINVIAFLKVICSIFFFFPPGGFCVLGSWRLISGDFSSSFAGFALFFLLAPPSFTKQRIFDSHQCRIKYSFRPFSQSRTYLTSFHSQA